MNMSLGSFSIFFVRPISLVLMIVAFISILTTLLPIIRRRIPRSE
jgi:TctA family transporter